jgi:hypothetical protein
MPWIHSAGRQFDLANEGVHMAHRGVRDLLQPRVGRARHLLQRGVGDREFVEIDHGCLRCSGACLPRMPGGGPLAGTVAFQDKAGLPERRVTASSATPHIYLALEPVYAGRSSG